MLTNFEYMFALVLLEALRYCLLCRYGTAKKNVSPPLLYLRARPLESRKNFSHHASHCCTDFFAYRHLICIAKHLRRLNIIIKQKKIQQEKMQIKGIAETRRVIIL